MKLNLLIILLCFFQSLSAQSIQKTDESWLDSIMASMSVDQKIGQLIMIRAFSKGNPEHEAFVKKQIKDYQIGGICFFQGSPERQAALTQKYQESANIPLFIAMDAEWGLGMRFRDEAISFPKNMTLGALSDHQLIYRMGKEIGRQLNLLGVNINFAPVLDINNNPANPVINFRSFGEDKVNVASKSLAFMKGMETAGVMSCAKHFPGHGDTGTDSHFDLPVLPFTKERLDSLELFPFRYLIQQGMPSIMVAHLQIPSLEPRQNRPSTVSDNIVQGLLREEMGFNGLIFTDGMEMKAVTKHFDPGEADLAAFLAGNDIILLPENIHKTVETLKQAVSNGTITMNRLDESVARILKKKFQYRLFDKSTFAIPERLRIEINSTYAQVLKAQIYEKAMTLVKNEMDLIPLKDLKKKSYGSISLGSNSLTVFQKRLLSYVNVNSYWLPQNAPAEAYPLKLDMLSKKDVVFVSLHNMSHYASRNFGLDSLQLKFIRELSKRTNVVLTIFGTPYALSFFVDLDHILMAYEEDELAQEAAAQGLFGAIDLTGKLPVSASPQFRFGQGVIVPSIKRLGFAIPEAVGLNSDTLRRIASIIDEMIRNKAAPGCEILIAKDQKIVYWKSFGYHTYAKKRAVQLDDLYDLASVTKVMASTLAAMHLEDRSLFKPEAKISAYIPEEDTTNKSLIIYEDILAHVGKLKPWIPFYVATMSEKSKRQPDDKYYRHEPCDSFSLRVSPDLYLRSDYADTIWRKVFSSSLREKDNYRYSDLAFYIMEKTVSNISQMRIDEYAKTYFYEPLGLRRTTYNPIDFFDKNAIVPSEEDDYYRMATVQGTVHDMGAAMLNGVAGHAGLFSNALDLGILMQMLLNEGYYGGRQFIRPETLKKYTSRHWRSSRRGLGFDMKELNPRRSLNMSEKASRHTFGHLGFTGTAVFGDPENQIVFVFLSNRTFPSMENNSFGKKNYRPRLQTIIYNALATD